MKNVVNLTLKFTIDHYLIGESRFKNEKYCFEYITYFNLKLQATQNFIRVAGYVELSSVPFAQTSQISFTLKLFLRRKKQNFSLHNWYLFKTAHELAKTKPSLRAPRNKPIGA